MDLCCGVNVDINCRVLPAVLSRLESTLEIEQSSALSLPGPLGGPFVVLCQSRSEIPVRLLSLFSAVARIVVDACGTRRSRR